MVIKVSVFLLESKSMPHPIPNIVVRLKGVGALRRASMVIEESPSGVVSTL